MALTAGTSTAIGACVAIIASILNAVGYTLQKQGHNKLNVHNAASPKHNQRAIITEKTWCVGFAIFVFGGMYDSLSTHRVGFLTFLISRPCQRHCVVFCAAVSRAAPVGSHSRCKHVCHQWHPWSTNVMLLNEQDPRDTDSRRSV